MSDGSQGTEHGSASRLRFRDSPPEDASVSCGQNVHNSRGGGNVNAHEREFMCSSTRLQSKLRMDMDKERPSDRLRHDEGRMPEIEVTPPDGESAAPAGEPTADGDRTVSHDSPRPCDKKAGRESKKLNKSKLRMEKIGAKQDAAREKLVSQNPPKRSGTLKTLSRMARAEAWAYTHGKIYQVEHENIGIESAHRTELAGEGVVRSASRFIKRRIHTRPARRVQAWERKNLSASADQAYRTMAREHPELKSNAVSRFIQKQRIKRQYQKQAREAARQGANIAKKAADITKRIAFAVWGFVRRHPTGVLLALCAVFIVIILQSCMASMFSIGNGLAGALGGASYLAEDGDINAAELAYAEWEADLTLKARNAENSHPGYDEYRYYIDPTGHDPHALLAYLTTKYDNFTFAQVEPILRDIFSQQYTLTFTRIVEVRYRTEYYTDDDGHEHSREVAYNYYILEVRLTARPFADIIGPLLDTREAEDRYELYNDTKGNRQYVGSPFPFNWLPYVSCNFGYRVHPISGEKDYHRGIDIALPIGTEILAGGEGVVLDAVSHSLYGLTVRIDYGGGVTARYSHCSTLLVSTGQTVRAGDVIGLVGSTGNSTGPHLDIEVMKDGELLNPLYFVVIPSD